MADSHKEHGEGARGKIHAKEKHIHVMNEFIKGLAEIRGNAKAKAEAIIKNYVPPPDPEAEKVERMNINYTQQTLDILHAEMMDEITEYYSDCGVMNSIKATFPDDDIINQYADYYIRYDLVMIEILGEKLREAQRPEGV
jgi:hypothetical protein